MIGNIGFAKIFFFMMIPALLVSSCVTKKKFIRSTVSYASEIIPGTVQTPTSDGGIANVDTVVIIYIQSKQNDLVWDSAVVNGQTYKVTSQIIKSNTYEAGTNVITGNKEIVTVISGNVLYQLQFQKSSNQDRGNILNEIFLYFRFKEKKIIIVVNKPLFILQQPSV